MGKIVTLDRRLIRKKLGKMPETTMAQLTSLFLRVFSEEKPGESPMVLQEAPAPYKVGKRLDLKRRKK
jgi:hypothetical protein